MEASDKFKQSDIDISRRDFLKHGGAALAASVVLTPCAAEAKDSARRRMKSERTKQWNQLIKPNIVIIMTDEERFPQHWPLKWTDWNLPNRKRLSDHGLTFTRAYCNASMCSPSRATLFTGLYPDQHGIKNTLRIDQDKSVSYQTLQPSVQNMAKMLSSAGYDVHYRGKWHLSLDRSGTQYIQSQRDLRIYGFHGWLPPDGGQDEKVSHFGGGCTDYDSEYADHAADYLMYEAPRRNKPFALIVSFINPHDIMAYPKRWNTQSKSDVSPYNISTNYGDHFPDCFEQNIELPKTFPEHLDENYKPLAQIQSLEMFDKLLGKLDTPEKQLNYVNFYAYLHKITDVHIGKVLDALESNEEISRNTIVIRLADHGEMGLSHGGLRQKVYNAYEETMHIPLVISNPWLFPKPVSTDALASLIDIMPTIATLADVQNWNDIDLKGQDLTPIIQDAVRHPSNPTVTVQNAILFTSDETDISNTVTAPNHIRCLRERDWKVVVYFEPESVRPPQFELYDLANDPDELHNMGDPTNIPYFNPNKLSEMLDKLSSKMDQVKLKACNL
ncbi:MAG: sulfatase-like hydrolase/transferase [Desulfatirhabdiaceae bacterium]